MAKCRVSGIVYKGNEQVAANVGLTFTPLSITGQAITTAAVFASTNSDGEIQFKVSEGVYVDYVELIQGGTYTLRGPILGGYNNAGGGNVTIPNSATCDFDDLISVAAVPSTGLTIKDEGVALASLIGTFDFVGSGVTVTQASPGVATVTITSGGGFTAEEVDGTPSFSATTLRVDQADGLVLTNPSGTIARLDLAGVPYSALTLTGGIVNADVNASAAIAYSKLNLTGAILNADLAGSIALTKLAALTASRVLVSDGSGVISPSSITSTTLGFLDATSSIQTQLNTKASTTYVDTSIANLVDSSPAALDTLNELAAALGDDANFATTVTNALAGKQTSDATLTALAAYNTNGLLTQTAADTFTGRTLTGTANQISVANGDGVSGNPTLSLPADVLIPTVLTVPNTGLHILDTNASHDLIIAPGSNLTADHTLTITTGDADRILTINGDATISGTNTGDQTITLTGDVTGSGTGSFATSIASGAVTNAMLAGSIALSKLSITGTPDGTKFLRDDGSWQAAGGGSGLTTGTTTIASGTNTRVLYNNSGVLGEYPITGTGNVVMSASPTLTGTAAFSGIISNALGSVSAPSYTFTGDTGTGLWSRASGRVTISSGGSGLYEFSQTGLQIAYTVSFKSGNGEPTAVGADVGFKRHDTAVWEINNATEGQWGALKVGTHDANVTAISNGLTIGHQNSSGTPGNGMGSAVLFNVDSSTSDDVQAGRISAVRTNNTHASRTSDLVFETDNLGSLGEAFRLKHDLSAVFAGIPRFNGTNTTGSGSALLGANSPAGTLSAPATWIQVTLANGNAAYIPAWS